MVAAVLLISGDGLIEFALASSLITLSWFYGLPYQMGLLARLDPQGRANVMGVLMCTAGAALGPAIAAMIISPGGYSILGWFAAGCYCTCMILILKPVISMERSDRQVHHPSESMRGSSRPLSP
jgi:predicted MFS family arabinose efflux permease